MYKQKKKNTTQQLIGVKQFTQYGIKTENGEILFFSVAPSNLSVLSYETIDTKLHHLLMVLSAIPEIGIICTDSCEQFDDNKNYLKSRLEQESNEKIRNLLQNDIDELDSIQSETATARQFLFLLNCKSMKQEQIFQTRNRVLKTITDQSFEAVSMSRRDIKKLLAIYFGSSKWGETMPDMDGIQYLTEEITKKGSEESDEPDEEKRTDVRRKGKHLR